MHGRLIVELYIEVKNGVPTNHPALKENLIAAFKALPEGWEPFVRVERPVLAFDEMLESASPAYQQVDGVWTDVWAVQTLTINEIEAKKEAVKQAVLDSWMLRPDAFNFTTWVYDEETRRMVAPISFPAEEGKTFLWSGANNNWKEAPAQPEAGGPYRFDFVQWTWLSLND
jgi:hypothetical protein